jgi:peptide/nickel transport system permease protein
MLRYIASRILSALPTLLLVVFAVFAFMHMIPGDPAEVMLGVGATDAELAALREKLGLNQSIMTQFFRYLTGVLQGDLGVSFANNQEVSKLVLQRLPATLELTFFAVFLACLIGIPLGVSAAVKQHSLVDFGCQIMALMGVSFPIFWLAIQLMYLFAVLLNILPLTGRGGPFYTLDGLYHILLPAFTLSTAMLPSTMRLTRSSMLEVLSQEYIMVARAKGLRDFVVTYKHALKNAIIPVVTNIGLQFGMLLGGAFLTETVFAWPGIGQLTVNAIFRRDFPVVQGVILITAFAFIMLNIIVDISYAYLDPKIRNEMNKHE